MTVSSRRSDGDALARYRPWFYAAALYNLIWGSVTVLFPQVFFQLIGLPPPDGLIFWQLVGMFVLVYAPGYWWAARYPTRHRHLIVIGLLGKVLGPLGFVWAAVGGQLPLAFSWTILANDLIWWPAFGLYLRDAARQCGGWTALLRGE
jgi:small multidrug resistance pump